MAATSKVEHSKYLSGWTYPADGFAVRVNAFIETMTFCETTFDTVFVSCIYIAVLDCPAGVETIDAASELPTL
jgi:hypothetical protein